MKIKLGLFCIGLNTYWEQFPGLRENLLGYHRQIADFVSALDVDVVDAGLVDDPPSAMNAGRRFRSENVELIFLFVSTYALSSTVLPVVQRANVPIVVLNLQPVAQFDYEAFNATGDRGLMTGIWLEHCQTCSAPEIASVFNRAHIHYHLVTGYLSEPVAMEEIRDWVDAAVIRSAMRDNRVGLLGSYYGGMLDVYSDLTQQSSVFGNHFELLEMCELNALRKGVTSGEMGHKLSEFSERFAVSPECEELELGRAARTAVALDKIVESHGLGSLAYYYEGQPGNEYEDIVTSMIAGSTLLTGSHVPTAGEYEVKNVQAMKILDILGAGGSFSEFYLTDFVDDVVYLGHDGPAHFAIAEGAVGLVPLPLYHGKPGKGLSIQMTVRHGPVTLLAVVQKGDGKLALLSAEAESVEGPVLHIGNTNSRYRFDAGARAFINAWCEAGPTHHCAIGVGHLSGILGKLSALLGIEHIRV